jgi:hypothetical protein
MSREKFANVFKKVYNSEHTGGASFRPANNHHG